MKKTNSFSDGTNESSSVSSSGSQEATHTQGGTGSHDWWPSWTEFRRQYVGTKLKTTRYDNMCCSQCGSTRLVVDSTRYYDNLKDTTCEKRTG